jgi:IrrE N-terminal-like domain
VNTRHSAVWTKRRRDALKHAERLSATLGTRLPVDIGALADACRIRRIEFRPLLVDGALGVVTGGFEIFVRCESYNADVWSERFASARDGTLLPANAVNKVRFTIAHEIAHTFFYSRTPSPIPKMVFAVDHPRTRQSLERACNRIAAVLLLPVHPMCGEFDTKAFHDPKVLRLIAKKALVSRQALVVRISTLSELLQPWAIIATASVSPETGEPIVKSVWRHYAYREMFPALENEKPLRLVHPHDDQLADLQIYGGSFDAISFAVSLQSGRHHAWTLAVEPAAKLAPKNSFFISLFRTDHLLAVSKLP